MQGMMLWDHVHHVHHGLRALVCIDRPDAVEHLYGIVWCPDRGDFPELIAARGRPEMIPADTAVVLIAPLADPLLWTDAESTWRALTLDPRAVRENSGR